MIDKSKVVPYQPIINVVSQGRGVALDDGAAKSLFGVNIKPDEIAFYPVKSGIIICKPGRWKLRNVELGKFNKETEGYEIEAV